MAKLAEEAICADGLALPTAEVHFLPSIMPLGVIQTESLDALSRMAQGPATTILIPSDLQGLGSVFTALNAVNDATGKKPGDVT